MHVKDIDVSRAQLLQRSLDGEVHRLGAVATIIDLRLDRGVKLLELGRVLHSGVGNLENDRSG